MGIDPGLADMGYGVIELVDDDRRARRVTHGVIRTSAGDAMPRRLDHLCRSLEALIAEHAPDAVAIEELFFSTNVKTAIVVAQARGVAILATARSGADIFEYSPTLIKMALVGKGRASKRQVQMMVKATLGLAEMPSPDHAADALAVALCHFHARTSILTLAAREMNKDTARGPLGAFAADQVSSPPNPNKALLAQARSRKRR